MGSIISYPSDLFLGCGSLRLYERGLFWIVPMLFDASMLML